jgi:hypothetical protein
LRTAVVTLLLLALAQAALAGPAQVDPPRDEPYFIPGGQGLRLGHGAWSYFGDPRSIAHGRHVFTGWIGTHGNVWVGDTDTRTRRTRRRMIYRDLGVDDHNNPSLVWFHGRLVVFFSEHSGRTLGKGARMRYRIARRPFTMRGGFGPVREVPTNVPGGLGYTYPNALVAGSRLFLFWRGGDWNPTFASSADARHWTRARTLVKGPGTRAHPERPYAKYSPVPGGFDMVMSDCHVQNCRTSLYYLRYRHGAVFRADGTRIGRLAQAPFARAQLDRPYRFRRGRGRAWPHDVASGPDGRPVIVYTRRHGGRHGVDHFQYTRFDGRRWVGHGLVSAGAGAHTFTSGGITLDHDDPSRVLLSRTIGRFNQVELWKTEDDGRSFVRRSLTRNRRQFSIRPVFPRWSHETGKTVVVYFAGHASSFTNFHTRVRMLIRDA